MASVMASCPEAGPMNKASNAKVRITRIMPQSLSRPRRNGVSNPATNPFWLRLFVPRRAGVQQRFRAIPRQNSEKGTVKLSHRSQASEQPDARELRQRRDQVWRTDHK